MLTGTGNMFFEWLHPEEVQDKNIVYTFPQNKGYLKLSRADYSLSKESMNVAIQLATCFGFSARSSSTGLIPPNQILNTGDRGGLLVYRWENGEYISFPIIENRIMLSRGDLDWLHCYPFVRSINTKRRLVEIDMEHFSHRKVNCTPYWALCRDHFGHLTRDTIACYLHMLMKWHESCIHSKANKEETIQILHNPVHDAFNKQLLDIAFSSLSSRTGINNIHEEIADKSCYLMGNLYFPLVQNMPYLVSSYRGELTQRTPLTQISWKEKIENPKVVYLGLDGRPHKRISNSNELSSYFTKSRIPALSSSLSCHERGLFLSNFSIMICDPSSSVYNYIMFGQHKAKCILMLPRFFEAHPSKRDVNDWSCILYLLLAGRIELLLDTDVNSNDPGYALFRPDSSLHRYNDIPRSYDIKSLHHLISSKQKANILLEKS
jgi:hypothetical protein